ncbi:7141_t:CDS:1, partial [Entrophospora sp. SA101]
MQETNMNSTIKFFSKKVLAEKPGQKRQILCEILIEEINQVLGIPETITQEEPPLTTTLTQITDQQPVTVENEIITRN